MSSQYEYNFKVLKYFLIVIFLSPFIIFSQEVQKAPNILWISTEDHNPAIGAYGDEYAHTPNLDQFASQGIVYQNAFVSSPICAPARSAIITGMYATSLGTQNLRSDVPIPDFIKTLPEVLQQNGYYTTNNSKTDYNFDDSGRWDESGGDAHWRNRKDQSQPFFSVFNLGVSHEGKENVFDDSYFEGLDERRDPEKAELPPFFPNTPEMKNLWARYYDLISVVDQQFQGILDQLEADGLDDNTIVIFWSDHGFGLPRYKRWLNSTGLEVALIARIPEKYQGLIDMAPGSSSDDLVCLVDLAPTMMSLAGIPIPKYMEGVPFLGPKAEHPRSHFIAHRDRADDVYDMARAVRTKDYMYVRHYYPHLPYIQNALIFGDQKRSYAELKRARKDGELPVEGEAMFRPRAREELFDIRKDPYELDNLAGDPKYNFVIKSMRNYLNKWEMETRDAGFLQEGEMMLRAGDSSVYEMTHDPQKYQLMRIKSSADMVGDENIPISALNTILVDGDPAVRYWGLVALNGRLDEAWKLKDLIEENLESKSPTTAIKAAEVLCNIGESEKGLNVLGKYLKSDRDWMVLQAAISIRQLGKLSSPLVEEILATRKKYSGDIGVTFCPFDEKVGYKNWSYPLFIGFALDQTLVNIGRDLSSINNK